MSPTSFQTAPPRDNYKIISSCFYYDEVEESGFEPLKALPADLQSVPGTAEAFRQIKERRPDILCIAGEAHEDLPVVGATADLVCNNDFVSRGYLIIKTAHDLGCDTFVHISFPRHMSYETMSRRVAVMTEACKEFGMTFVQETAPDPTTDVGITGAQAYVLEKAPEWIQKYGQNSAYYLSVQHLRYSNTLM